jgi:hypothetical protein
VAVAVLATGLSDRATQQPDVTDRDVSRDQRQRDFVIRDGIDALRGLV